MQTYRYILVTAALSKAVNSDIHYRALQAKSELDGAYNPRTVGHDVVVPWDKRVGERLGGSNEPYLSTPAQHPEVSRSNPARSQSALDRLYTVLQTLEDNVNECRCSPKEILRDVLFLVSKCPTSSLEEYTLPDTIPYDELRERVYEFLSASGNGERLSAVTAGVFSVLYGESSEGPTRVEVSHVNTCDKNSGNAGDIEIWRGEECCLGIEAKDKTLSGSDIRHCLTTANRHKLGTYVCVVGPNGSVDGFDKDELPVDASAVECTVVELNELLSVLAVFDNNIRTEFIDYIGDHLDNMRASRASKQAFTETIAQPMQAPQSN